MNNRDLVTKHQIVANFFVVVLLIVSMKIVVLMSVNSCISDTNLRKYSNVVLMHVHRGKSTT